MTTNPGLTGAPIYVDYNATTPVDPAVVAAMQPYLAAVFGNPSSAHRYAAPAAEALATARTRVAALIGADPAGIVFTGSGSEADNLAIRGTVLAAPEHRRHVITQATEHPAVLTTCHALQRLHGVDVSVLAVDSHGLVDPANLRTAIRPDTALVSIMSANNETGTLQPIAELAAIAHAHGTLFHTDAAQAAGKIPLDVEALGIDLLTMVGHKMYAPKGIAALWVRPGVALEPIVYGGGQEFGLRAGTENVAYTVALGVAADLAGTALDSEQLRLTRPTAPCARRRPTRPGAAQRAPRTAAAQHAQRQHRWHSRHGDGRCHSRRIGRLHRIGLPQRRPPTVTRPDRHGSRR
jgi:cysteine desulfurase